MANFNSDEEVIKKFNTSIKGLSQTEMFRFITEGVYNNKSSKNHILLTQINKNCSEISNSTNEKKPIG